MTETPRRRAPGMTPEARREMIVAHTLPLFLEHGANVSTQLIAQTAGIGEATVFRAFEDKAALLRACMQQAVRPEPLVDALDAVPRDLPLADRLARAAEQLSLHSRRIGIVMEALMVAGVRLHRDELTGRKDLRRAMHEGRERSLAVTSDALGDLMAPDAVRFRVPVATAATTFQFLVMALMRKPFGAVDDDQSPPGGPDVAGVVDMFLHGAVTTDANTRDTLHGEECTC